MSSWTEDMMPLIETYRCADAIDREAQRSVIRAALEAMARDRDTLAEAVIDVYHSLPEAWSGSILGQAVVIARRIKRQATGSKPDAPKAAMAEAAPAPQPAEYDLVVATPGGRAWRYKPGKNVAEYTAAFPDGTWVPERVSRRTARDTFYAIAFTSMPAALKWWHETHPKPAEGQPADVRSTLDDRLEEMEKEVGELWNTDEYARNNQLIYAIKAVARAVEELAKEAKR